MKRFIFSIIALCLLFATVGGYMYVQQANKKEMIAQAKHELAERSMKKYEEKSESIIGAYEYMRQMKANSETGEIDVKAAVGAIEAADRLKENSSAKAGNIEWEFMGPNNVGGRTRAILMDKDNPDLMVTGGVAGGIFTSTNGGLSWTDHPQNTEFRNLSITALAQAPNGDIYVGTGEFIQSGFNYGESKRGATKMPGNGIYKSTDRGTSFQSLASTVPSLTNSTLTNLEWVTIQDIEINTDGKIYVATNRGLQISEDEGETWTKASGVPIGTISYDIVIADNGTVHVVAGSRYYRSTDGSTFDDDNTGNLPGKFEISSGNKVIAMSRQDNNYLYIVTVTGTGCLRKVWQSQDGGNTWIIIGEGTAGSDVDANVSIFDPMNNGVGCQGWYDLCVAVDPANRERIFIAGITFWSWSARDNWNQLDVTFSGGFPYYLHADKHTIEFHPSNPNVMYIGSDGGIARSTDAQNTFPTFAEMNKNYNTTQFYGMAAGFDGRVVGGTQDNSTIFVSRDLSSAFAGQFITGGDGGFCDISKINPLAYFAESQNGAIRRTGSGTPPLGPFFDTNTDCNADATSGACDPDGELDGNPLFITPFVLWENPTAVVNPAFVPENEQSIFVTGACDGRVWMTREALNFSKVPTWIQIGKFAGSRCISAVAVSDNGNIVYAGTLDGRMISINLPDPNDLDAIPTTNESVVSSGQYITGIDVDFNQSHIVISLGEYGRDQNVLESFNANSVNPTYVSIQNNLPLMPVYDIVIDPFNFNNVFAGTELGIWQYNAAAKTWTEENGIIGRTPVHSLRFQTMKAVGCEVLYAGTHGRGMFRTVDFAFPTCDTKLDTIIYENITNIDKFEDQVSEIKIYPNPMVANSTLELTLAETTDLTLRILSLQGQVVRNQHLGELEARTHQIRLDKNDLVAGNYVVMLVSGDKFISKKLIVQ